MHYFPIIFEILHFLNACSNPWHAIFPGVSRHGVLDLCVWSQCVTTSLLTNALLQYLHIFPSVTVLIKKSPICICTPSVLQRSKTCRITFALLKRKFRYYGKNKWEPFFVHVLFCKITKKMTTVPVKQQSMPLTL